MYTFDVPVSHLSNVLKSFIFRSQALRSNFYVLSTLNDAILYSSRFHASLIYGQTDSTVFSNMVLIITCTMFENIVRL
jgi:hypothetical protein